MEHRSNDLAIEAKWSTGQRTPLWDAFWHRILADIAPGGRLEQSWDEASPLQQEDRSR
jgi:hypothetical protein